MSTIIICHCYCCCRCCCNNFDHFLICHHLTVRTTEICMIIRFRPLCHHLYLHLHAELGWWTWIFYWVPLCAFKMLYIQVNDHCSFGYYIEMFWSFRLLSNKHIFIMLVADSKHDNFNNNKIFEVWKQFFFFTLWAIWG